MIPDVRASRDLDESSCVCPSFLTAMGKASASKSRRPHVAHEKAPDAAAAEQAGAGSNAAARPATFAAIGSAGDMAAALDMARIAPDETAILLTLSLHNS